MRVIFATLGAIAKEAARGKGTLVVLHGISATLIEAPRFVAAREK